MTFNSDFSPITFCGCGWLAGHFIGYQTPFEILGTTRAKEKTEALRHLGVTPFIFQLGDDPAPLALKSGGNAVVINIPPGARKKPLSPHFVPAMKHLIQRFVDEGCERLIFVSTTAVYGEDDGVIDEQSATAPVTPSGFAHVEIENFVLSLSHPNAHILRLSGLVGPDRHPVKFLAGRQLDKGEQAVNLVHVKDVSRALSVMLTTHKTLPKIIHLNSLKHPRRDSYYTWCASQLKLNSPRFSTGDTQALSGKRIHAEASWQALGLTPEYDNPYAMIKHLNLP